MENMFERTMMVCLTEKKKNGKPSKLDEAIKSVKPITEAEEADLSYDLPEEDADQEMTDIQDDVVVVVDPELDADEVEDAAAAAQEIVDGTPEGEVPTTDEYVGDKTYTCPICGNTFFSDTDMAEGDVCPVCGETPSAFVLVGEVADAEEAPAEDAEGTEDVPEDAPVEDEPVDDVPDEEIPEEDDEELECYTPKDNTKKSEGKVPPRAIRKPVVNKVRYQIDESTFNPYMTKFIREHYSNARSFKMTGATLNKNRVLTLECVITFKSGKTKNVKLKTEGFRPFNGKRAYIDFKEDGAFKTESKSRVSPFIFTTSMKNNVIKCEGMKFNFMSRVSENKKAHIYGKVVLESRNFRRGDRK